jgi:FlaA1/EpsC-like NDP-sugar epimerase
MDVRRLTRQITLRRAGVVLAHAVLVSIGYLLAFVLRFDLPLSDGKVRLFLQSLPLLLGIRLAVFGWARLYQGLWRYSSMRDVAAILKATAVGSVVFMPAALGLFGYKIQRSVFVLEGLLCLILVGGARLLPRLLREASTPHGGSRRSIVVGAGDAAEALIREMQRAGEGDGLIGLVDDDRRLQGRRIHGVQVLGTLDDLPVLSVSKDVDEILVAIPSATQAERRRIVTACRASALPLKTVPSFRELLDG